MINTVIGLGSIGFGVACSLVRGGFTTYGVARRDEVLAKFTDEGGYATKDIHNAVARSDVVFIYVVNAAQVNDILFGEHAGHGGCVASARAGTVFVLGVTMAPNDTVQIAEKLQGAGMQVIDAPVSGDAKKSYAGELTLMASGKADIFQKINAPLQAISANIFNLGETIGAGSSMKMVNQLLAGIHIASMGEAMAMATRMGLDLDTVYEVILKSAGCSWMFVNRGAHVRDGDYTKITALDIFVKDMGIVNQEATSLDFTPSLAQKAFDLYCEASQNGLGQEDDAAIAKWIARKNGVRIKGDTA